MRHHHRLGSDLVQLCAPLVGPPRAAVRARRGSSLAWTLGCAAGLAVHAFAGSASAATKEIGPGDNLGTEINSLQPGDELVLRGGAYTLTSRLLITVTGTAAQPIVVRAKDGETPIITRDSSQNTINIEDSAYLELLGLEITGGSHGVRINDSDFITIQDCHVHGTADVAISANMPGSSYQGLRFIHNHIHNTGGTGEGFYLGCNDAGCVMFDSVIEGNYIHHTNMGVSQGDGIEVKQGSYGNLIKDNVIHDTGYPCIIVYGTAGNAVNTIEGNAMWNCGDHGIQAAADATIINNLILSTAADGIHSQVHQGATPGNLTILHNTILVAGAAVRVDAIAGPVLIANNALYSSGGYAIRLAGDTGKATLSGNLGTGSFDGTTGFDASGARASDFVNAAGSDVFPAPGSRLISAGDSAHSVANDFNGTSRSTSDVDIGAYVYASNGNPGWPVGPDFKQGGAAGSAGAGGSGAGGSGAGGSGAGGSGAGGSGASTTGGSAGANSGGANSGGAGNSGAGGSGATATGGTSPSGGSSDDSGCGCSVPGGNSHGGAGAITLGLLIGALGRRRKR